jgi:hypothetical protein
MERPHVGGTQFRKSIDEPLQPVLIPAIGIWRTMPLHSIQKRIRNRSERFGRNRPLLRLGKQLFVAVKGLSFVRTEVDLLAVQRDVPDAPSRAIPRLRKLLYS